MFEMKVIDTIDEMYERVMIIVNDLRSFCKTCTT